MASGDEEELKVKISGDAKGGIAAFKALGAAAEDADDNVKDIDATTKKWNRSLSNIVNPLRRVKKESKDAFDSIEKIDTSGVDDKLKELKAGFEDLALAFAATADPKILKQMSVNKRQINVFEKAKKDALEFQREGEKSVTKVEAAFQKMAKIGSQTGKAFSTAFTEAVPDLFKNMPPQAQAAVGAVIATALPMLGAAVEATVGAALGGGAIIAGILAVKDDPRIQEAAEGVSTKFGDVLQDAAKPFVPAVEEALGKVKSLIGALAPDLKNIFAQSAKFLSPLVDGVGSFIQIFTAGASQAMGKLQPIFDEFRKIGPMLGQTLSTVINLFANNSQNAASGLHEIVNVLDFIILSAAQLINALTSLWGVIKSLHLDWLTGFGEINWLMDQMAAKSSAVGLAMNGAMRGAIAGASGVAAVNTAVANSFTAGNNAAINAGTAYANLTARMNDETNAAHGLYDANTSVAAALAGVTSSIKDNGRNLDINSEKGRANRQALSSLVGSLNSQYNAYVAANGEGRAANNVAAQNRASFIKAAEAFHMSGAAAADLANKIGLIPPKKQTDLVVNTHDAQGRAQALKNTIDSIQSKSVTVTVNTAQVSKNNKQEDMLNKASGGFISGPGTSTSDSIPARLSNGEYVVKAASVRKYGIGYFNRLNSGAVQKFAKGGHVKSKKKVAHHSTSLHSKYINGGTVSTGFQNMLKATATGRTLGTGSIDQVNNLIGKINDQGTAALDKMMKGQFAKLAGYANQRAAMAAKLDDARKKLDDAIQVRDQYKSQIADSAIAAGSLTSGPNDVTNANLMIASLNNQLVKTRQFKDYLDKLKSMGLNSVGFKQIADGGVDGGFAAAKALAEGGQSAVNQVNNLQGNLVKVSNDLGSTAADRMYQAGVNSAQGLVNGLLSQEKALDNASTKLANQILGKLRTVLKIHSPSEAAADEVGKWLPLGIAKGVDEHAYAVHDSLANAVNPQGLSMGSMGSMPLSGAGSGIVVHVHVAGSVTTERKLAESIAPHVRDAIVRRGKNNGGRTGL